MGKSIIVSLVTGLVMAFITTGPALAKNNQYQIVKTQNVLPEPLVHTMTFGTLWNQRYTKKLDNLRQYPKQLGMPQKC